MTDGDFIIWVTRIFLIVFAILRMNFICYANVQNTKTEKCSSLICKSIIEYFGTSTYVYLIFFRFSEICIVAFTKPSTVPGISLYLLPLFGEIDFNRKKNKNKPKSKAKICHVISNVVMEKYFLHWDNELTEFSRSVKMKSHRK